MKPDYSPLSRRGLQRDRGGGSLVVFVSAIVITAITITLDDILLIIATITDLPRQRTIYTTASVAAIICRLKFLTITLHIVLPEMLHIVEHIL